MICNRCRRKFSEVERKCPYCGKLAPQAASGVFQTSTVLISASGADMLYRSMDDVPDPLRAKLLQTTNSANSATILIADRRGREEIARVMRNLPGTPQRHSVHALLAGDGPANPKWLTPRRKRIIFAFLLMFVLAVIAFVFGRVR
jgi:hypothetical protein